MTFVQARNRIISLLTEYLGCDVRLSGQINDMPNYRYCYYSVLAPRISDHAFGLSEVEHTGDEEYTHIRCELVEATMSFTFCSENRETEAGYILGEDDALELAEKGHCFFLLQAHNIHTDDGDIVIRNVGNVANRSSFLVEDTVCRYGFDVRFAYVRADTEPTTIIENGNGAGAFQK